MLVALASLVLAVLALLRPPPGAPMADPAADPASTSVAYVFAGPGPVQMTSHAAAELYRFKVELLRLTGRAELSADEIASYLAERYKLSQIGVAITPGQITIFGDPKEFRTQAFQGRFQIRGGKIVFEFESVRLFGLDASGRLFSPLEPEINGEVARFLDPFKMTRLQAVDGRVLLAGSDAGAPIQLP